MGKMHAVLAVSLFALAAPVSAAVTGDYIEARSAAVHAGACHFNGEMTTAGREAVLAFRVREGAWDGVRLDGLSAVAVVSGSANLADRAAARRSVLYVTDSASAAQRASLEKMVRAKAGAAVGTIVAVRAVPQSVSVDGQAIEVRAGNAVRLSLSKYPCDHCTMPSQTWYTPLVSVTEAKVAQGLRTGFTEPALGVTWTHEPSDNAFVGTFSF